MHERAKHTGTKTSQDEESKADTKKSKRMEMLEFDRYSRMCGIKEEEVSKNL